MLAQITDPARELAELSDHLRRFVTPGTPNQEQPSWQVLSEGLQISASSAEFLELLSVVRGRMSQLENITIALDDPTVSPDIKEHVQAALHRFSNAFNPAHLNHAWKQVLASWIIPADATTLRMFSSTAIRYFPLKRLSIEERNEAFSQIKTALIDIKAATDIDFWEKQALVHGYERLEIILKCFECFGHEGLAREYVLTATATRAAQDNLKPNSNTLVSAWKALVLTAKIVEVIAAPSVAHEALRDYSSLLRIGSPPPAAVLLLAPPQTLDPTDDLDLMSVSKT